VRQLQEDSKSLPKVYLPPDPAMAQHSASEDKTQQSESAEQNAGVSVPEPPTYDALSVRSLSV